jgi:hypothetical protein
MNSPNKKTRRERISTDEWRDKKLLIESPQVPRKR